MKEWTHEELHLLMDRDPLLRARSDKAHAIRPVSPEAEEQGKLEMMGIYADAVHCKRPDYARNFVREVFVLLSRGELLDKLCQDYTSKRQCHAPLGNNYVCFCIEHILSR